MCARRICRSESACAERQPRLPDRPSGPSGRCCGHVAEEVGGPPHGSGDGLDFSNSGSGAGTFLLPLVPGDLPDAYGADVATERSSSRPNATGTKGRHQSPVG